MRIRTLTILGLLAGSAGTLTAQDAHPCNTCELGFVHGAGEVTISYTLRTFISGAGECELTLCETIQLDGVLPVTGVNTYDDIQVLLTGTRTLADDSCCTFLTPTVIDIEGTAFADFTFGTETAIALGEWFPLGGGVATPFIVEEGPATCSSFTKNEIWFDQGNQYIQNFTVTFTGGPCVPDGGGDPDPPDDDPPNDDPPDVDPPDPPIPPNDPPDDPDPPIPPEPPIEPPDTDPPIPPDPPLGDECCAAITARLDILAQYMDTAEQQRANTNSILHDIHVEADQLYSALVGSDVAILPYIRDTLHYMRQGLVVVSDDIKDIEGQVRDIENIGHSLYQQDRERYEQEIFRNIYLQQILGLLRDMQPPDDDGDGEPDPPEPPITDYEEAEAIEIEQPVTAFTTARDNFKSRLITNGKSVTFFDAIPTTEPDQPTHEYLVPGVSVGGTTYLGFDLAFDYQQYGIIRLLVYAFVLFIESMACIRIVFEETRKY